MKRHVVDTLLVLTLFFTYVAGALLLCVMGAGVYKNAAAAMEHNYNRRTGALYLTEKIRQHDTAGGVRLSTMAGLDALVLTDSVQGGVYETWIYVRDGQLCEVMVAAGQTALPSGGQAIMPMNALQASGSGGQLHLLLVDTDGQTTRVDLSPRCTGEGGLS